MRVCAIGERTHAHRKMSYGVAQRVLCRMVLTRDAEGTIKHMPNAKLAIFSTASPSACPLRIALHRTAHCLLVSTAGTAVLPYLPTYLPQSRPPRSQLRVPVHTRTPTPQWLHGVRCMVGAS